MGSRLDQYRGLLSASQVAEGMNAAIQNASRLAEDAQLLYENGRFPSACSVAILSIEESGKLGILRRLAGASDVGELKQRWREYRTHTAKNVHWIFIELFAQGARKLDDFGRLFDPGSEHPDLLDQLKQIGFYSDCLGRATWSIPQVVIDKEMACRIVSIATLFSKTAQVTQTEIELWIRFVTPHLHGTKVAAEAALQAWYEELQRQGLAPRGPNGMTQLINGTLSAEVAPGGWESDKGSGVTPERASSSQPTQ